MSSNSFHDEDVDLTLMFPDFSSWQHMNIRWEPDPLMGVWWMLHHVWAPAPHSSLESNEEFTPVYFMKC